MHRDNLEAVHGGCKRFGHDLKPLNYNSINTINYDV